jgi:hypothetical protein
MNRFLRRSALRAGACALLLWAGQAAAAVVAISNAFVEARVPGSIDSSGATTVPANLTLLASSSFGDSRTDVAYAVLANTTSLSFTSSYTRVQGAPTATAWLNQSSAWLFFTVDQDATYSLSGVMAVDDRLSGLGPTYGTSSFRASLFDVTDAVSAMLLTSERSTTSIEDASFVFGEDGNLAGSLNGALLAGRTYKFEFRSRMETPVNIPYGDMTAFSNVTFRITADNVPLATPLPEPGSLALVLAAALGAALSRRRRS